MTMIHRIILAAILAAPLSALAVCYTNDSGATYCYYASECPTGTTWRFRDQLCQQTPAPPPVTTGSLEPYQPAFGAGFNFAVLRREDGGFIMRVGNTVAVYGVFRVKPATAGMPTQVRIAVPDGYNLNTPGFMSHGGVLDNEDGAVRLTFTLPTYDEQIIGFFFRYDAQ